MVTRAATCSGKLKYLNFARSDSAATDDGMVCTPSVSDEDMYILDAVHRIKTADRRLREEGHTRCCLYRLADGRLGARICGHDDGGMDDHVAVFGVRGASGGRMRRMTSNDRGLAAHVACAGSQVALCTLGGRHQGTASRANIPVRRSHNPHDDSSFAHVCSPARQDIECMSATYILVPLP